MVDNTAIYSYPGGTSYDNIATEDIGGKKHQKIRLNIGAPGVEAILAKGQQTKANSVPVTLASDQDYATQTTLDLIRVATQLMALWDASGRAKVIQAPAASSTVVVVAYSTTNVTLLAANANRRGAAIYNNNSVALVARLGANASAVGTLVIPASGYYEVPFGYTGIIDGYWVAGGSAAGASVTELLP